ncbi:M20 family metallopeptidase [Nocardioides euryhalodurans]|uniref:Peptidase M20 domain-containing protein 2 n=1 Tax=Nocardioides euryhalodurans TaxID=2518370 RepID=A0A4P7GI25_9ACTN|nr:M20 family metallopeptidase [Nocardioides euryhalodurans]QBR91545.1 M20 family peptidase [Nocardioides euryhalodurans]
MHDRASNIREDAHDVGSPRPPDDFLLRHLAEETRARARTSPASASPAHGADPGLLEALSGAVAELGDSLLEASHDLSAHPEVSFEEHRSAAALADLVESHGIEVVRGAHGLDTALRAEVGDSGPTMAVLSEYDALPGIGHGCGHNVIATAGLGAFLALAAVRDRLPGRVVWLGTPAEEGGGGKELMAQQGAFDGVDAALMVHPFTFDIAEPVFLGRRQLRATFTGITSHASAQPFMGRNALDAVNLMYTGVGLHRQQLPPTDRVHGVVTAGGERPNVIPEHAEMLFYLRSEYPESLAVLSERLADIARGAALMTGCGVELSWDEAPPYLPVRGNRPLAASWTTRYAERGRVVLAPDVVPRMFAGSTDFGNVSYRVPGVHAMVKITDEDLSLHTRDFADAAVTPEADRVVLDAAYALAAVTADYLSDADLRAAAAADFEAAGGAVDVPSYFERR